MQRHCTSVLTVALLQTNRSIHTTMKSFQVLLIAVVIACAAAFAPASVARPAFKATTMAMSKMSQEPAKVMHPNAAALVAFATAMAPLAAQATTDTDELNTVIGLGIGLVACVVSLAVGFTIGYGTLVKP